MDSLCSLNNSKKITLSGIIYKGEDTYEDERNGSPISVLESLFLVNYIPCLELK
jgi:hypothetical protein